jgi:ABC-type proline/glycine betaine transport system substrate-binding protein
MNTYFANLLGRRLRAARWLAALLVVAAALSGGCATMKMPKWPWTGEDAAAKTKEGQLAEELGEDADSDVLSSEYVSASADTGFDYFKGENIKKRWKKMVGRARARRRTVPAGKIQAGHFLLQEGDRSLA